MDAAPVQVSTRGSDVLLDGNISLLKNVPFASSRTMDESGNEIILGFESNSGPTHSIDIKLGKVSCTRWTACARNKLWWMTPAWGQSMSELPTETQFLLLEHDRDGPYTVMLPLIDSGFRATLKADRDKKLRPLSDSLVLRIESGDDSVCGASWQSNLLIASSFDLYEVVQRGMTLAARLSGTAKPLHEKSLPDSINHFGWCTWDAFYSRVSASGVSDGLKSLHAGGVRPRTLIIDDGWQSTHVDDEFKESVTTRALRRMKMPVPDSLDGEFEDAEQSVLASYTERFEGSSDLATSMPMLSDAEYRDIVKQHLRQRNGGGGAESRRSKEADRIIKALGLENAALPEIEETLEQLSKKPRDMSLWSRLLQRIAGWLLGILQVTFLTLYQGVVDPAAPNSWAVFFFEYLATGPLKWNMLQFFKASGDFTKRITSVKANRKFADPSAGPDGPDGAAWLAEAAEFRRVTDHWRETYNIDYVYCWHGLPAYWGGVMPGSEELAELNPRVVFPRPTAGLLEIEPAMRWNPAVLAGIGVVDDAATLYQSMHRYLSAAGVDGVKVDCQAGVGLVGSVTGGGPTLSHTYHAALEDSIARHLPGNHAINCMCHSTENIYRMRDTAVIRASDDFYPREAASSTPHIAACAYNSLFLSALCQPDWDMFQSRHPAAHLHAVARAVSGGAVYVSDKVGRHDFELLRRLVLRDGSVLRAMQPGRPTKDCVFEDPLNDGRTALKVWTRNALSGVVAAFNLQGSSWNRTVRQFRVHDANPQPVRAACCPSDVGGLRNLLHSAPGAPTGRLAAFRSSTGTLRAVSALDAVEVTLPAGDADVVTFAPIVAAADGVDFAPVGLANMLNCGGAVESWLVADATADASTNGSAAGDGARADSTTQNNNGSGSGAATEQGCSHKVAFRGEGLFVAFAGRAPAAVQLDGKQLPSESVAWDADTQKLCVTVPAPMGTGSVHHRLVFTF